MKLRHPLLIKAASLPLSWILRIWLGTLTYRIHEDKPDTAPDKAERRGIYLFWHEMLLFPAQTHANRRIAVLVSHHADGELIAQIIRMMGGASVRGSTNKRGMTALRNLMRHGQLRHLAITPDGPRGPRRVAQPGAVYLASRTGMPILPVGVAYRACWRMGSWDRLALPHPGTRGQMVIGPPLLIPPDLTRDGLECHRARVQAALDEAQSRAERCVSDPLPRYAGGGQGGGFLSSGADR